VLVGTVILVPAYLVVLGAAKKYPELYVPGPGPWIVIAKKKKCHPDDQMFGELACSLDAIATVILFMDGLVQVAGGTMIVVGVAKKKKSFERDDAARLTITPGVTREQASLLIQGRF
jgi:hypothetical protein